MAEGQWKQEKMSPAVSVSEPVGSDGILDCRIAGLLVRIEALPPGVWARMADLFRPFVVEQDVHDIAEPVARFRVIRRGRGDWIARQFDVNGHPVGTEDRRRQAAGATAHPPPPPRIPPP